MVEPTSEGNVPARAWARKSVVTFWYHWASRGPTRLAFTYQRKVHVQKSMRAYARA
jgi:hypothetical protein